ncbi:mitochondrial distribution and morphology protein 10 [Myriangium duriaei CBS 260.36]|uniref:Mitochondrial distribution and morphology protein 10 n=1 Tax=Myriangium duriaei CBS 260.36 TaxID=1168546 RepID=A0A9P4J781_9PEZI|nr:mitochondrial distribution and morphology protein 10 [Myriangium duriaei CBS 260.36]
MLQFMDYVQNAFYHGSRWNSDNFYGTLTATANALLDFRTPNGLGLNVSSLSSQNFATSYALGTKGVVEGSFSYLYSSLPLRIPSQSHEIFLRQLVPGYRRLGELVRSDDSFLWELWHKGKRIDKKDTLLYGRLFLPSSTLQALYLRHISPTRLLRLSCVSDAGLPNGGSILALLQQDCGKYSTEYLYSTDSALLGFRGLYNFGFDPRKSIAEPDGDEIASNSSIYPLLSGSDHHHGRLSAGGELYFSPLNKSGGVSTAVRFTTLPSHPGFPYTMTLTLNPLMGSISSSYAVQAMSDLALCSRFSFNFYSYESDVQLGMEMWRRKLFDANTAWARRMLRPEWQSQPSIAAAPHLDDFDSVLKAKIDQRWKIGLLWEGRINELLVSVGAGLDLKNRDRLLGSIGVEVSYSS